MTKKRKIDEEFINILADGFDTVEKRIEKLEKETTPHDKKPLIDVLSNRWDEVEKRFEKLESSKYILANADDSYKGMIALYVPEDVKVTKEEFTIFMDKHAHPNPSTIKNYNLLLKEWEDKKPKDSEVEELKKQIERMESYREHRIKLNDTQKEEIDRLKSCVQYHKDLRDAHHKTAKEKQDIIERALEFKKTLPNTYTYYIQEEGEDPVWHNLLDRFEEILEGKS